VILLKFREFTRTNTFDACVAAESSFILVGLFVSYMAGLLYEIICRDSLSVLSREFLFLFVVILIVSLSSLFFAYAFSDVVISNGMYEDYVDYILTTDEEGNPLKNQVSLEREIEFQRYENI